jgi:hypothetical protein
MSSYKLPTKNGTKQRTVIQFQEETLRVCNGVREL